MLCRCTGQNERDLKRHLVVPPSDASVPSTLSLPSFLEGGEIG